MTHTTQQVWTFHLIKSVGKREKLDDDEKNKKRNIENYLKKWVENMILENDFKK